MIVPPFPILTAAVLAVAAAQPTDETNSFLLDDVALFDGERHYDRRDVLVENGVIARVARRIRTQDGVPVIDGEGLTAIPGLIDAHVHAFDATALSGALRFGVTTQLDMFTDVGFAAANRPQRESTERTDKADFWSAGTLITSPGGHGTQFGLTIPTLTSAEEAPAFIAARAEEGADYIKIAYEPGRSAISSLDPETLKAAIEAAHDEDLLAVVHITTLEAATDAVEAGADGLVHGMNDAVPGDAFLAMARDGALFVIATLAVNASVDGKAPGADAAEDEALAPYLSGPQRGQLATAFPAAGAAEFAGTQYREAAGAMHAAGIPILAGSDAPNPGTTYGATMHTELKMLVEAGLTPTEALVAATSAPADAFGLKDRGRIEPGMRADIVLLTGDPTEDITATRTIEAVYKNGYAIDRAVPTAATQGAGPTDPAPADGALATFDDGLVTHYGPFMGTTDQLAGGASTVSLTHTDDGTAKVEGTVSLQFPFPWSGGGSFLSFDGSRSTDWSDVTTMAITGRGDGRDLTLMLFTATSPQQPATGTFTLGEEMTTVRVDLTAIQGADLASVFGFAIVASRPEGDFSFELNALTLE